MHICFVSPNLYPVLSRQRDIPVVGGAEFRQSMLARAFAGAGHQVSVITQDFGQPDGIIVDGVKVFKTHTPSAGLPGLRFFHPRLSSVLACLKTVGADLYFQSSASHLTGVVAWHGQRSRALTLYSGASDTDFMKGQERMRFARDRLLFRWGLGKVSAIVAQTERQRELVQAHYDRPACVIRNAYRCPQACKPRQQGLVLWVGGIRRVKRPERFITLARSFPERRFRMIGGPVGQDSAARDYFEAIRREAAGVPNLEFLGFVPVDLVESHFDEAGIFVNTSDHEGFPNTFLQAWSRGIPTVSYFDAGFAAGADAAGPYFHVLTDEEAAARLRDLLENPTMRETMSAACRRHFLQFHSEDSVVRDYEALFDSLHGKAR